MISAFQSAPAMDPPPQFFPFFPSGPESGDLAMATCPLDQTESAAATIAELDLSDPAPAAPLNSYVVSTTPAQVSADVSFSGTGAHPIRTPSRRRDDGPARKRARIVDSPEFEFESVDYWMRFNEEDMEGDFGMQDETDPSRRLGRGSVPSRQNNANQPHRPSAPLEPQGFMLPTDSSLPQFDHLDLINEGLWDSIMTEDSVTGMGSLNLAEEMARIDSVPPREVPPRDGLYSTPLSWEQPQPGSEATPLMSAAPTILSDAERRRLLDIAMNTSRTSSSFVSGFDLDFGDDVDTWSAPTRRESSNRPTPSTNSPHNQHLQQRNAKSPASLDRQADKMGADQDSSPPSEQTTNTFKKPEKPKEKSKPSSDRAGHNDIERKYRTNLKDKIAELRDAVPALRSMLEERGEDEAPRAAKVSKGTILTKATEYIRYLERRNQAIKREHQELETKLHAFEQLMTAAAKQSFLMQNRGPLFDPRSYPS